MNVTKPSAEPQSPLGLPRLHAEAEHHDRHRGEQHHPAEQ